VSNCRTRSVPNGCHAGGLLRYRDGCAECAACARRTGAGRDGAQPDPWPATKKLLAVADVQTGFHLGTTKADATPQPLPKATSPQGSQADPLPEDAGKSTVLQVCGSCHAIETAVGMRGSEKEWREVVELMVERGATGSEEDFRTVVAYLAKHFGPK
jgi:mono/diheme cytochrome c family protein